MKNMIRKAVVAGMVSAVAGTAAAEVSVTADFASAYVFRGSTFNDGFVIQPGIEASGLGLPEAYGALTVGAWGNVDIDDYANTLPISEFSEIDWYGSYSLPVFVDSLDLFIGYTDYTYPGAAGASDKEANIGAGYEIAGVGLGLTYYQGIGGAVNGSTYIEFALGYGFDFSETLSGSVDARFGYADYEGGESGFNDYDIGASLAYALGEVWSVGATLTYIGQGDDVVLPDGMGEYDVDVVGVLSLGASF